LPPGYTTRSLAACEQSGFEPRVKTFTDRLHRRWLLAYWPTRELAYRLPHSPATPPQPSLASSLASSSRQGSRWSGRSFRSARAQSPAIARFLGERRDAAPRGNGWLLLADETTSARLNAPSLILASHTAVLAIVG